MAASLSIARIHGAVFALRSSAIQKIRICYVGPRHLLRVELGLDVAGDSAQVAYLCFIDVGNSSVVGPGSAMDVVVSIDTYVILLFCKYHTYYSMCDTDVSEVSSIRNTT